MMEEEILEGNKLIAEFMQIETQLISPYGIGIPRLYSMEEEHQTEEGNCTELSYDCSWDWLMPVVEKIENMCPLDGYTKNSFVLNIQHFCTLFDNCFYENPTIVALGTTKIESIYKAVVEFIKFYNDKLTPQYNQNK